MKSDELRMMLSTWKADQSGTPAREKLTLIDRFITDVLDNFVNR